MQSRKLHIALVANTSWSIYNFRLGVIRSFLRAGHTVSVIAPRDSYTDKLVAEKVRFIDLTLDNYSNNPIKDLSLIFQFYKIYSSNQFDKVFHYTIKPNIYGSIAARINRLPSIAVTTGLGRAFQFRNKYVQKLVTAIFKLAIKGADEIWMLNTSDYNKLVSEGIAKPHKSFILPSEGVNTQRFRPSLKERNSKIIRFLFAGRLLKDKGIYQYVAAARILHEHHPHIKCEVLGFLDPRNQNSVQLEELNRWQEEGIINYLGSTEDVRPFIDRADCIVFPSFYQEGISRILLEAASMSTPIITTDHVGCAEVVQDQISGYHCRLKDVQQLTALMGKFIQLDKSTQIEMGQFGRSLVKEKYDERIIIEIYKLVIEGKSIASRQAYINRQYSIN